MSWFDSALSWLNDVINNGLNAVLGFLVNIDPFPAFIDSLKGDSIYAEALKILNRFVDLEAIVGCLEALVAAIAIYYGLSIVLRWLKVIE